jgi:hypothetical protein
MTSGLDPDQISCTVTLRAARRAITSHAPFTTIHAEALTQLLPPRRRRSYPRHTRTSTSQRRTTRTGLTGTTTYQITITHPASTTSQPSP